MGFIFKESKMSKLSEEFEQMFENTGKLRRHTAKWKEINKAEVYRIEQIRNRLKGGNKQK